MPNWCENELRVYGPRSERERLKQFIRYTEKPKKGGVQVNNGKASVELFEFDNVIPYPKKFRGMDEEAGEKRLMIEAMSDEVRKQYVKQYGNPKDGFNSGGYEWCCKNWGTKWGARDAEITDRESSTLISFSTAWSPSLPVSFKLSELFPKLKFTHSYWECGSAYKGKRVFKNGECLLEQDSEYNGGRGG